MKSSARAVLGFAATLWACDIDRPWPALEPSFERMMVQPRVDPYSESDFFPDGISMRPPPAFSVAYRSTRGMTESRDLPLSREDPVSARLDAMTSVPIEVDRALLSLGRHRFQTVCAACHGVLGDGRSPVAERMSLRRPPSLHDERIRGFSAGHVYDVIARGFGLMPSYAAVLDERSRWAVVAYLEALQLSRNAKASDVPSDVRAALNRGAP